MTAPVSLDTERQSRRAFLAADVLAATDITYRQLDYWTRTGLITASGHTTTGHGDARWYHETDVVRVACVSALIDAGLSLKAIRTHIDQVLDLDGACILATCHVEIRLNVPAIRQHVADYRRHTP